MKSAPKGPAIEEPVEAQQRIALVTVDVKNRLEKQDTAVAQFERLE